eukprot:gene11733-biopygen3379
MSPQETTDRSALSLWTVPPQTGGGDLTTAQSGMSGLHMSSQQRMERRQRVRPRAVAGAAPLSSHRSPCLFCWWRAPGPPPTDRRRQAAAPTILQGTARGYVGRQSYRGLPGDMWAKTGTGDHR